MVKRSLDAAFVALAILSAGLSDLSGTLVVLLDFMRDGGVSVELRAAGRLLVPFLTDSNTDMLDLLLVMKLDFNFGFFVTIGCASAVMRCLDGE
jgi:hypothetical protein